MAGFGIVFSYKWKVESDKVRRAKCEGESGNRQSAKWKVESGKRQSAKCEGESGKCLVKMIKCISISLFTFNGWLFFICKHGDKAE